VGAAGINKRKQVSPAFYASETSGSDSGSEVANISATEVLSVGTRALYLGRDGLWGVDEVQVVQVHFDDIQPYYTIRLSANDSGGGGSEKQTERHRLRPTSATHAPPMRQQQQQQRRPSPSSVHAADSDTWTGVVTSSLSDTSSRVSTSLKRHTVCELFCSADDPEGSTPATLAEDGVLHEAEVSATAATIAHFFLPVLAIAAGAVLLEALTTAALAGLSVGSDGISLPALQATLFALFLVVAVLMAAAVACLERCKGLSIVRIGGTQQVEASSEPKARLELYSYQLLLCFCDATVQHWSQACAFVCAKAFHQACMTALPSDHIPSSAASEEPADSPFNVLMLLAYAATTFSVSAVVSVVRAMPPLPGKFRQPGGLAALFFLLVQMIGSGRMRCIHFAQNHGAGQNIT
jgi:hypothetical protein